MRIDRSKLNKNRINEFSEYISFSKEEYAQVSMLRDIKSCHVDCKVNDYGTIIEVDLSLHADLVLECSYSLEDVDYPMEHQEVLEFSDEIEDEDIIPFNGNSIELDNYILEIIIAKLPLRIKKQNAKTIEVKGVRVMSEDELEEERNSTLDPRLKALDDWEE